LILRTGAIGSALMLRAGVIGSALMLRAGVDAPDRRDLSQLRDAVSRVCADFVLGV